MADVLFIDSKRVVHTATSMFIIENVEAASISKGKVRFEDFARVFKNDSMLRHAKAVTSSSQDSKHFRAK